MHFWVPSSPRAKSRGGCLGGELAVALGGGLHEAPHLLQGLALRGGLRARAEGLERRERGLGRARDRRRDAKEALQHLPSAPRFEHWTTVT